MKRTALYFTGTREVRVTEEEAGTLPPGKVLVRAEVSAVSAGTEMLFYRGMIPAGTRVDETIREMTEPLRYPLKYGYAVCGTVIEAGSSADRPLVGKKVFSYHPHESLFAASPDELVALPGGISPEDAVFLPQVETALALVQDGAPLAGECAVVFGQGVVGLLTTALLARLPLGGLAAVDGNEARRTRSRAMGAEAVFAPGEGCAQAVQELFGRRADLSFELSGKAATLGTAARATAFSGRVVVGSWYGEGETTFELGTHFHRSRLRLVSSQVSTIEPSLAGRWTKERRRSFALKLAGRIKPSRLITHRLPVREAAETYRTLDRGNGEMLGVVFTYEGGRCTP